MIIYVFIYLTYQTYIFSISEETFILPIWKTPFLSFQLACFTPSLSSLCSTWLAPEQRLVIKIQRFIEMIFQRGWEMERERERQEWGRERGMHIQWSHDLLADKPSIAAERGHNEHSIEELTSHVKPLPVWLKGKKEGLYLLMIGPRTKLILFSTGRRTFLHRLFF